MSVLDSCKNGWSWLRDETNRKILAWIGSGIVFASSGMWVAYQKLDKAEKPAPQEKVSQTVSAPKTSDAGASKHSPSAGTVIIGEKGIVGGRDVTTGPVHFGD